jgi:hypothetical protein
MLPLKTNRLLLWLIGLHAAFFALGWFPDGIWLSAFCSGFLVISGSMLASTALPDAYTIVRRGEIGAGELAVLSIAGMAFGLTYSGVFGLAWSFAGRPDSWIGPISSYGRAMTGVCMFLMFLSPEATRKGIKPPRLWVVLLAVILVALVAFLFGVNFRDDGPALSSFDTSRAAIVRLIRTA